jgi:dTDP-4-dehydrorhamnose reductase
MGELRVAVTGTGGYIGGRAAAVLSGRGHAVLAWDRRVADVGELDQVRATVRAFRPDVVVHSAAMSDPGRCAREPGAARRSNVIGTANIATACREQGCRLVFLSTDYVFDGQAGEPYTESHPVCPRWDVYGDSKIQGEALVRAIVPEHHILRLTWQFGPPDEPGLPPGGGWWAHVTAAARAARPILVTAGERRTITNVYDTIDVIGTACDVRIPYGTYHVVGETDLDWLGVTRAMLSALGAPTDLAGERRAPSQPADRRLAGTLLPLTGQPALTLDAGIARALAAR